MASGFAIGTLACSFAKTYEVLLLARALTGLFGGILGALILAIIGEVILYQMKGEPLLWV